SNTGVERGLRRGAAGPVDGNLPDAGEEPLLQPALESRLGEVLELRGKGDTAAEHQRQEKRVRDGEVVTGEDGAAPLRDVLRPLDGRPEEEAQQWTEKDPLHQPVQHLTRASRSPDVP